MSIPDRLSRSQLQSLYRGWDQPSAWKYFTVIAGLFLILTVVPWVKKISGIGIVTTHDKSNIIASHDGVLISIPVAEEQYVHLEENISIGKCQ